MVVLPPLSIRRKLQVCVLSFRPKAGCRYAGRASAACSLRLKLMNRARFRRLGAGEKRFAIDIRAVRRCELARVLVDVNEYDAFRNVEGLAGVARECAR